MSDAVEKEAEVVETVTLTVDGKEITVPKGTNLIKAAEEAGVEVPHYCYHPHLSVPGNCRICQMEVVGAPKLMIGCHTQAQEGMEVKTHKTSEDVADAQASTLEFILINHPLDCTVCDQAGHCKLQDYHFRFNGKPSRFLENKVRKVKAESLGPTVMLDGERCIMCTRCIRFCDEVTGTSELGMLNRGDKSVISINPGKELDNPLSGSVVDLCPVGALTHKEWRFNTRIWYTNQTDSICPGCSTGCNVKVAERDGEVVQVKARPNCQVNKEWLCDEGRYGFDRFLPKDRVTAAVVSGEEISLDDGVSEFKKLKGDTEVLIFVAPDLLTEEYHLLAGLVKESLPNSRVVLGYRERELSDVEKILISPDYAPNYQGAVKAGLVSGDLEAQYSEAIDKLKGGSIEKVLLVGDRAIAPQDQEVELLSAITKVKDSFGLLTDKASGVFSALNCVLPGRSILEKSGLMVNRKGRLQYSERVVDFPAETHPEWRLIDKISAALGGKSSGVSDDRGLTLHCINEVEWLSGKTIKEIKKGGVCLGEPAARSFSEGGEA